MADLQKKDYPCAQKDLYSVLETAWGNYGIHLPRFMTFKGLYNEALKTTALAAIAAAKALPDDDARSGASELLHIGLVDMGKVCLQNFQFLKSYIDSAFADAAVQKVQHVIAGQNSYRDASRQDWESVVSMNTSAKNYLAANEAALVAGNNMPPGFVDTLVSGSDEFDIQYGNFKLAEETSVATAAKIQANNACYHTGIGMLKDGQVIFMNEPEIGTKFVFGNLLALINPPVAGIKGNIKEAVTNAEVPGVTLTAQKVGGILQQLAVEANGDFGEQLSEGSYTVRCGAAGFVEQVFELDLKLTGFKTLNVVMEKTV